MSAAPKPDIEKIYLSADSLLSDSCTLASQVLSSGFRPKYLVALWRGGTPVGICMQEILAYFDVHTDHIAIRTSLYEGIERRAESIRIHGLGYIIDRINSDDPLLIVDDIYDTGITVDALITEIHRKARRNTPQDIRVAAAWFKPAKNLTERVPDYYAHATDKWVVFPHELLDLEFEEIRQNKPDIAEVLDTIRQNM